MSKITTSYISYSNEIHWIIFRCHLKYINEAPRRISKNTQASARGLLKELLVMSVLLKPSSDTSRGLEWILQLNILKILRRTFGGRSSTKISQKPRVYVEPVLNLMIESVLNVMIRNSLNGVIFNFSDIITLMCSCESASSRAASSRAV